MGEYFRGWRRKLGLVTLVLACTITGLWRAVPDSDFDGLSIALDVQFTVQEAGFQVVWQAFSSAVGISEQIEWLVPYSTVVIPLTLLSAFLLLFKPRQKPSARPQEVHYERILQAAEEEGGRADTLAGVLGNGGVGKEHIRN